MKKTFLQTLTIELTTVCPLRCKHCYLTGYPIMELSYNNVTNIIDQACELNFLKLTFTGGDVLCYPFLSEVLFYAKSKGFCVNVLSSLYSEDSKKIDLLKKTVHQLGVSLYGSTPDDHDFVTGIPGSFKITDRNIRLLRTHIDMLNINVTLLRHNIGNWQAIQDYVKSELNANLHFNFQIFNQNGVLNEDLFASEQQIKLYLMQANVPLEVNLSVCNAGRKSWFIAADGSVYPCVFYKKFLGNIYLNSLKEILLKSTGLIDSEFITKETFMQCNKCDYNHYFHGCIGDNYSSTGSVTTPSKHSCYMCQLYSEVAKERQALSLH